MMRRVVDATIPALGMVATMPVWWRVIDVPSSMRDSIGVGAGILWAVISGAAMASVVVGIATRKTRPVWSFRFEFPALIVAGMASLVYGVVLLGVAGWRGWTAAWFVWAIGAHFTARYIEAGLARAAAVRADG